MTSFIRPWVVLFLFAPLSLYASPSQNSVWDPLQKSVQAILKSYQPLLEKAGLITQENPYPVSFDKPQSLASLETASQSYLSAHDLSLDWTAALKDYLMFLQVEALLETARQGYVFLKAGPANNLTKTFLEQAGLQGTQPDSPKTMGFREVFQQVGGVLGRPTQHVILTVYPLPSSPNALVEVICQFPEATPPYALSGFWPLGADLEAAAYHLLEMIPWPEKWHMMLHYLTSQPQALQKAFLTHLVDGVHPGQSAIVFTTQTDHEAPIDMQIKADGNTFEVQAKMDGYAQAAAHCHSLFSKAQDPALKEAFAKAVAENEMNTAMFNGYLKTYTQVDQTLERLRTLAFALYEFSQELKQEDRPLQGIKEMVKRLKESPKEEA
jgi:hypothetical protein